MGRRRRPAVHRMDGLASPVKFPIGRCWFWSRVGPVVAFALPQCLGGSVSGGLLWGSGGSRGGLGALLVRTARCRRWQAPRGARALARYAGLRFRSAWRGWAACAVSGRRARQRGPYFPLLWYTLRLCARPAGRDPVGGARRRLEWLRRRGWDRGAHAFSCKPVPCAGMWYRRSWRSLRPPSPGSPSDPWSGAGRTTHVLWRFH